MPENLIHALPRHVAPPRRMWWVYLVVLLALATSGAGAAEALFVVRDYGDFQVAQACLTSTGSSLFSEADSLSRARADTTFADCSADYNARRGAIAVVGAVALPLVAVLFMIMGGAISRRGLRRHLGTAGVRLAQRF